MLALMSALLAGLVPGAMIHPHLPQLVRRIRSKESGCEGAGTWKR